jgi:hypothetical protein
MRTNRRCGGVQHRWVLAFFPLDPVLCLWKFCLDPVLLLWKFYSCYSAEDANVWFFCDHERRVTMSVRTHDTLQPKERVVYYFCPNETCRCRVLAFLDISATADEVWDSGVLCWVSTRCWSQIQSHCMHLNSEAVASAIFFEQCASTVKSSLMFSVLRLCCHACSSAGAVAFFTRSGEGCRSFASSRTQVPSFHIKKIQILNLRK